MSDHDISMGATNSPLLKKMTQKSMASRVSIAVSIVIHVIAFIAFAFVKFYAEEDMEGERMSVTFIQEQKTRVLKRSLPGRLMTTPGKIAPSRSEAQQVRVSYKNTADFYIDQTSEPAFSEVKSARHSALRGTAAKRTPMALRPRSIKPMAVELKKSGSRASGVQLVAAGGSQIFGDSSPKLAAPEINLGIDAKSVLQTFLDSVRGCIESNKKYPATARDAGAEGTTGVRITILRDGTLDDVVVTDSSGHQILDKAALQSVRNAAPFPPIPEETKRAKIEVSIYLVFKIT